VLSIVSSEDFVSHATQSSQGTKMPRADWKVLVKYPILVPPKDILNKRNEFMQGIVDMLKNIISPTATCGGRATCCCRAW